MTLDEINAKAMEMIVAAGAARNNLNMALNALYDGDEEKYAALMKDAEKSITESHRAQTVVLQQTITDVDMRPNILFTHAQDTLMTIMSEINMGKQLAKLYFTIKGSK